MTFFTLLISTFFAYAQKYKSESSSITFYSEAAIENITATNTEASSIFNSETGEIAFLVPIKHFQFDKSLMQQHFNEKYMESHKFPMASFEGTIVELERALDGKPQVQAVGRLSIHGETQIIRPDGLLFLENGKVIITSVFVVRLADYGIKIPKLLWQNIAEQVEVTVKFTYVSL